MIIISHRGFWKKNSEKNTALAFDRSFLLGFGTETDIRDWNRKLVISHDMPDETAMPLEEFFEIYKKNNLALPLALNIKADGIQSELMRLIEFYDIKNYFVFDMAVPDGLVYCQQQFRCYTRQSEYEPIPAYYEQACGVWLDEFIEHWITDDVIEQHLDYQKSVCVVSPDLHKRNYRNEWAHYKCLESRIGKDRLMLCTDYPIQAQEFFNA